MVTTRVPRSIRVIALVVAPLLASCASSPFPRETTAAVSRTDDPWLEGPTCAGYAVDDAGLGIEELAAGPGRVVARGETVRVHYVASTPSGPTLHDTHDGGPPIEMVIGSTKMICGFERAIIGMHAGGQRRVFVPWRLAFGEAGRPPDIQPKADLVFVIDLFTPADPHLENGSGPPRPATPGRRR